MKLSEKSNLGFFKNDLEQFGGRDSTVPDSIRYQEHPELQKMLQHMIAHGVSKNDIEKILKMPRQYQTINTAIKDPVVVAGELLNDDKNKREDIQQDRPKSVQLKVDALNDGVVVGDFVIEYHPDTGYSYVDSNESARELPLVNPDNFIEELKIAPLSVRKCINNLLKKYDVNTDEALIAVLNLGRDGVVPVNVEVKNNDGEKYSVSLSNNKEYTIEHLS